MPDDFDNRQKWLSRMIKLRNTVAHIPSKDLSHSVNGGNTISHTVEQG